MHKLLFSLLTVVSLSLLLFFHGGEARQQETPFPNACHFSQINSLAPAQATKFEAGQMEVWDHMSPELQCAGVTVVRITLQSNSIFLPAFFSPPALAYVVQGEGVMGTIASGCPETYEDIEASGRGGGGGDRRRRFEDMHQKLENFRRGDVFASLAGVSQWWYNRGDSDVVIVIVLDVTNRENQLDQVPRMFQLAGSRTQEEEQQQPLNWPSGNNAFSGFDANIIAEAFKVDTETAKQLQNQQDNRGNIVRANGPLHFVIPQPRQWQQDGIANGIEETYCTARLHENIDDPERSDLFSTRAGRMSTLNSLNLPVLRQVRLNAVRGYLYSGGMVLPQWTANAHTVLYVTGGQAKIQVVDDNGQSVFNEQMGQGQLLVIPQGFAVVKTAGETGFEWISFKTNDNAYINTLSGQTSYLRAVPLDVVKASYGVTEEEAKRIKFSQQEAMLAMTPSSSS
ncbi:PREDICTED: 12S seed storage protein CRD [Camelina sativa]|uniref:12S seed storage protein CRD n=1 Tax=Camelina sativa TaxID=90675 RepID=A0AA51NHJ5_CAMSA|nr:PREDICTED: 12S seed storage protein CRD [Camelina sativa]UNP61707.1 cruciferin CruD-1-G1 [Camelina sativa]WMQ52445.1 Cruciferin [Camelina sativa]